MLAYGQDTRGQVIGRVEDATGAVVAGARVTGANLQTGVTATAKTSASGDYVLPFLIPGTYTVTIEKEGFHRSIQKDVLVQVDDKAIVNVKLEVGATSESISVTAESSLVDASDASMSQTVDARSLTEQ